MEKKGGRSYAATRERGHLLRERKDTEKKRPPFFGEKKEGKGRERSGKKSFCS